MSDAPPAPQSQTDAPTVAPSRGGNPLFRLSSRRSELKAIIKLKQGDDVIRDEVIRSLADSQAKFVLKDDTNLMLGPNSRIKLDKLYSRTKRRQATSRLS